MGRRPRKRVEKRRARRRPLQSARRRSRVLRPLPQRLHNLSAQLTSFVGREREIAEIKRLLGATRLLTLIGPGGCGKTRLALQVAADLVEGYPDGVWLAEFAPIADAALVPKTVASALNEPEQLGCPAGRSSARASRTRWPSLRSSGISWSPRSIR